jgi:RNA polymerase sigma factor (sigma-70 family)
MTNLITRGGGAALGTDAATDGELVGRWAAGADPDALEALVRRHGGMVFGVCRRALGNTPDADDAFQSTFLVLVRKAHTLARPEQVAGWLHGVALRVATKARAERGRRQQREGTIVDVPAPDRPDDTTDLRRVLDEELDKLPEKYRLPIVLCELEGRTLEEAAKLLGWPKGTVAGRLSRGRELLRQRLSRRRGFVLPLFLTGGAPDLGPTDPPEKLVADTIETATRPAPSPHGKSARRPWLFWLLLFLSVVLGAGGALAYHGATPAGSPCPRRAKPPGVTPATDHEPHAPRQCCSKA